MLDERFNKLREMLVKHEGLRIKVYDDANGDTLIPGATLIGHPSIGIGRCLDLTGITEQEAYYLLANDIKRCAAEANAAFPWFNGLSVTRQDVILSMIFNLGIPKLKRFTRMLGAVQYGNYEIAADEMLSSTWHRQVGKRAKELAQMMRTG